MDGPVLITGANGRIGRTLVTAWASRSIVALDREDGDLVQYDSRWVSRFGGIATVVHLAADPDPAAPFESAAHANILSTLNVLRACSAAGVARLVYASSVWADYAKWRLADEMTWYAASKIAGEALVEAWAVQERRPAICLRIGGFDPSVPDFGPPVETLRVDEAALVHHVEEALAWCEPRCAVRYALGRLNPVAA
jgi:uronate dehydrogenase